MKKAVINIWYSDFDSLPHRFIHKYTCDRELLYQVIELTTENTFTKIEIIKL